MGEPMFTSPEILRTSPVSCISWHGGFPLIDHIHTAQGISTVLQTVQTRPGGSIEAHVPPIECAVLLVRVGSGATSDIAFSGSPQRTGFRIGEGCLMAPGTDSMWTVRGDHAGGWFHVSFDETVLATLDESGGAQLRTIPHVADPAIGAIVQMFHDLTSTPEAPDPLLWQSLGHVLLWRLQQLGTERDTPPPRGGLAPWQARRTTEYLADNLDRRVTLDELAAVARLSPFHFARAFARTVGMPPYRYQRKLRMERACELLARSDLRIIDVALAVGYESPQALARVFTQAKGMTPSEWRRRNTTH